jgi:predicted metal-dependent hydrolase
LAGGADSRSPAAGDTPSPVDPDSDLVPRAGDHEDEAGTEVPEAPLGVEVVRSPRRRKTIQAYVVDGRLRVLIPARATAAEESAYVERMQARFQRRGRAGRVDLEVRAADLARRYDLPRPTSIRWADNQQHRWGSCTPVDGSVRLSTRLAGYPRWVLDYVLMHELAHLVVADHSPAHRALVERYPKAERARGFLIAKELDGDR